jgi:hypothetical protein
MRLYVSCPAYLNVMSAQTANALLAVIPRALAEGLISDCEVNFHGEALINRCRNVHANRALKEGFDKILHIDSDIDFTYEDFRRLVTSFYPFVGGSYPLKCLPPAVNFNPLPGKGNELLKGSRGYDYAAFEQFVHKYADHEGMAEVRHLPTGFLCVDMSVFKKISETAETYVDFHQETGERVRYYDFYPTKVVSGELGSEDWGLCNLAAEAGFKIMFDTRVIVDHFGGHMYRMNQVFGEIDLNVKTSDDKS